MTLYIGTGDITKVKNIDVIINPANGIGVMGAGLAGAIIRSGGDEIQKEAREICKAHGPYEAGNLYVTDSGLLKKRGVKHIYHAVTMKFPGQNSNLDLILLALKKSLTRCAIEELQSIAIPGLGTGIGRLDCSQVAQRMSLVISLFVGQIPKILVMDRNEEFIESFKKSVKTEYEIWQAL